MAENLALEIVLPTAAEFRLPDSEARHNEKVLRDLCKGWSLESEKGPVKVRTGSKPEGLALEWFWNEKYCDKDVMLLYNGGWAVSLDFQDDEDAPRLVMESTDDHAFRKVRPVGDLEKLVERMGGSWVRCIRGNNGGFIGSDEARDCFVKDGDQTWLHPRKVFDVLRPPDTDIREGSGPAASAYDGRWDVVPALVCQGKTPEMNAYMERIRDNTWLTNKQKEKLVQLPVLLVCKGQEESPEQDLQWRESWSMHELYLLLHLKLHQKQAYWGFKYTFSNAWENQNGLATPKCSPRKRTHDGALIKPVVTNGKFPSYFHKTILLWELEEGVNQSNDMSCPVELLCCLLHRLSDCLENRCIPNYFIPGCNLLDSTPPQDITCARVTVDYIQKNTLAAIIRMNPCRSFYGDDDLRTNLLKRLSDLRKLGRDLGASCKTEMLSKWRKNYSWVCNSCQEEHEESKDIQKLENILCMLDNRRVKQYLSMCDRDYKPGIDERSGLRKLQSMLGEVLQALFS